MYTNKFKDDAYLTEGIFDDEEYSEAKNKALVCLVMSKFDMSEDEASSWLEFIATDAEIEELSADLADNITEAFDSESVEAFVGDDISGYMYKGKSAILDAVSKQIDAIGELSNSGLLNIVITADLEESLTEKVDPELKGKKPVKTDNPFEKAIDPKAVKKVSSIIDSFSDEDFDLLNDNAIDAYSGDKGAKAVVKKLFSKYNLPMWALEVFVEHADEQIGELLTEAKSKNTEALKSELEDIKADYEDFGAEGFYNVSYENFRKEFPEFSKACIDSFIKEFDFDGTPEDYAQYWTDGELIMPEDWPALIEGAEKLADDKNVSWEKIFKKYISVSDFN